MPVPFLPRLGKLHKNLGFRWFCISVKQPPQVPHRVASRRTLPTLGPAHDLPNTSRTSNAPCSLFPCDFFASSHIQTPPQAQRAALPAQLPQSPQPSFKDPHRGHCAVLLTLLPSATLSQIRVSEGQQRSTKKAQRDGCCPATGAPLAASQLQGTAMYKCSRGRAALILFNRNTKQQIPSRGQNISELTLWHLYACFIFFFFFGFLFRTEASGSSSSNMPHAQPAARSEAEAGPHAAELQGAAAQLAEEQPVSARGTKQSCCQLQAAHRSFCFPSSICSWGN